MWLKINQLLPQLIHSTHYEYQTNLKRAASALLAGASAGTIPIILMAVYNIFTGYSREELRQLYWGELVIYGLEVFAVWLAGLIIVAVPLWALLHWARRRSWQWALALGGFLPFIVVIVLMSNGFGLFAEGISSTGDNKGTTSINGILTRYGWADAILCAGELGLEGLLVSLVIWRVAYRRVALKKQFEQEHQSLPTPNVSDVS